MTKGIALLFLILLSTNSYAKITISSISFDTEKNSGNLKVYYKGDLDAYPDLKVMENKVYVYIPDSVVNDKIDKKIAFAGQSPDTEIRLDSWKKNEARVLVELPFDVQKQEHKVAVLINDNSIIISMPKLPIDSKYFSTSTLKANVVAKTAVIKKVSASVDKEILNENFLRELESQQKKAEMAPALNNSNKASSKKISFSDMRSSKSPKKGSFNIMEYGAKFAAFLAVVLVLFYGLVTLFKKGFIKKGKLGFLHKSEQVQVISQTYVAPKKSLMLIKAYNQVFLVSNSDTGITLVSEIKDPTGLIKESEREAAGSNFDDTVNIAEEDEASLERIKLKEDIAQSNGRASLSDYLNVRDKVKFSDQIKNKVKNLKPLQ